MPPPPPTDIIGRFARHPVAANLLMTMMLLAGAWALTGLNKQFFPNFALDFISVGIAWSGASAEDVETSIANPVDQELRTLDGLRKILTTSSEGLAILTLEYQEGTDMGVALDQVKERIALIRNLPESSEEPRISRVIRYEPVVRLLVSGPSDLRDLRPIAREMERELLSAGIDKVIVVGLPKEEIAIQIPTAKLRELDTSLDAIAERVADLSRDIPAGTVGRDDVGRQLRALEQRRRELQFERLLVLSDRRGRRLTLGDIGTIERRPRSRETTVTYRGRPAVELQLHRSESGDSLEAANRFQTWLADKRRRLPPGIELLVYDEAWELIWERIVLLLKNGGGGLVLVVGILFLFLNGRVAIWVALGIPVSLMAALGVLLAFGGSINMVSLFALIMTLGIIVDDAIVVGEDALTHYQMGEDPLSAAEGGARRMLAPVMSSSLTTIAAFIPLLLIGGIIGNILFDIPLIVICVILASLVESFLVLPGHLRHAFGRLRRDRIGRVRARLDRAFVAFRERLFAPLVKQAVARAGLTLSVAVALLLVASGLVAGKRIAFDFFPSPEATVLHANVSFVAGTPPARVRRFMEQIDAALRGAEAALGGKLVKVSLVRLGRLASPEGRPANRGDQFASMMVELVEPDQRTVRNPEIIQTWRARIRMAPGIESFSVIERRGGPPGRDVDVRLTGESAAQLKTAALDLAERLKGLEGVAGVEDDMPFGPQQLIYRLTPEGHALGLTVEGVGRQLRAAYDGNIAQIFQDGEDEIEVRVMLPDAERNRLSSLEDLAIVLPSGGSTPLLNVVEISARRGFEVLRHADGKLAVQVSADLDPAVATSDQINRTLRESILPDIEERHGVGTSLEGRAADQRETLADMKRGGLFAFAMIYLVLAWVFGSYGWPLVVMSAIPFGLVGALFGHWLMGIDLTILSLFGVFGLSGIVVNDSIILVTFYRQLRAGGMAIDEAIAEAACQRLRAVLLTSLTTIAGLTPLLFETSLQAQFLIPMAVSISFGLAFSTLLVLLFVPALLSVYEHVVATREPVPPVPEAGAKA